MYLHVSVKLNDENVLTPKIKLRLSLSAIDAAPCCKKLCKCNAQLALSR